MKQLWLLIIILIVGLINLMAAIVKNSYFMYIISITTIICTSVSLYYLDEEEEKCHK